MFAFTLDFTVLLPLAAFGLFSIVAWIIADHVWGGRRRIDERLQQLQNFEPDAIDPSVGLNPSSSAMSNFLGKATPTLAHAIQPKSDAEVSKLKQRLSTAGFRDPSAATIFLGLKVAAMIAGFLLGGGSFLLTMGITPNALIRAVMVTCIAFFVPDVVLYVLGSKRKQKLFLGLPDALDLMVVSVEAGLGLDQAMRKVAEEMTKAYPLVAYEFGLANAQMQIGTSRVQVLRDLGRRNGEEDLQALASVLIQAAKFGSGVGQALRIQSDTMRRRRRQLAEEKANKTAVKLIFPLVLFIFPGIFVILVGPAAISMIRNLFPAMTGG